MQLLKNAPPLRPQLLARPHEEDHCQEGDQGQREQRFREAAGGKAVNIYLGVIGKGIGYPAGKIEKFTQGKMKSASRSWKSAAQSSH